MAYDAELADRLRDLLAEEPDLTEKRMFGGLAMLVDGRIAVCAGSHGDLMLRADPSRLEELLSDPRMRPFEMSGRGMKGWLSVDVSDVADDELGAWIDQAVAYVRTLPPK